MKRSIFVLLLVLVQLVLSAVAAFAYSEDTGALDREGKKGMMRGAMICPVMKDGQSYMVVTSPQGHRIHPISGKESYHAGVDLDADMGDDIVAAAAGTVTMAGWFDGYGNTVMINHGGDLTTLYGHNNSIVVSEGQAVQQGQLIAKAGSTGNSTGPHCHFEVRPDGNSPVDPGLYVPGCSNSKKRRAAATSTGTRIRIPTAVWWTSLSPMTLQSPSMMSSRRPSISHARAFPSCANTLPPSSSSSSRLILHSAQ